MDPRLSNNLFRDSLQEHERHGAFFGPFHHKRSRSQTVEDDQVQITSGMLWGATPRGGRCPTVQAYFGRLPPGAQGIEFLTPVRPWQLGLPDGLDACWYHDDTAFTGLLSLADGRSMAVITVVIVEHKP